MNFVKLGSGRYINLERVTHVEQDRKGRLVVHFAVGGGDVGGPTCSTRLEGEAARSLQSRLDSRCEAAQR